MAAPSFDEIAQIIPWLENDYYNELFHTFQEDEDYYELDYPVDVPKDVAVIKPPTARVVIDTACEFVPTESPRVFVYPQSEEPSAQKHAEKLRQFYLGFLYSVTKSGQSSVLDVSVKHLFTYGEAVLKTVLNTEAIGDKDYIPDVSPIDVSAIHPRNFMPDPSRKPAFVVERCDRLAMAVKREFPRWKMTKKPSDTVKWYEYWDNDYYCYIVDDAPMGSKEPIYTSLLKGNVKKHGYGFIPYVWKYSGFGMETINRNPVKMAVGILRYLKDLIVEEASLWSQNHSINTLVAWPTYYAEGATEQIVGSIKINAGVINPIPVGVKITRVDSGMPSNPVLSEMAMAEQKIFDAAAPRVVRGLTEGMTRSGYDRSLQIALAELHYGPPKQALNYMISELLGNVARLIERRAPFPITMSGRIPTGHVQETLKPSDVKGHYTCYVELSSAKIEDEFRKSTIGATLAQAGIISTETAGERYAGVIEPREERVKIEVEKMLNSEEVQAMMNQFLGAELNKELMTRQIEEGEALPITPPPPGAVTAGGQPQRFGQPTAPGQPPPQPRPFSAEESQRVMQEELQSLG